MYVCIHLPRSKSSVYGIWHKPRGYPILCNGSSFRFAPHRWCQSTTASPHVSVLCRSTVVFFRCLAKLLLGFLGWPWNLSAGIRYHQIIWFPVNPSFLGRKDYLIPLSQQTYWTTVSPPGWIASPTCGDLHTHEYNIIYIYIWIKYLPFPK